jgi:diaminopimelate decarboxylase
MERYEDLDMAGYTCIESDYLYRNYSGQLSVGDFIVFDSAGSYSVVMKPPFIMPNVPILELNGDQTVRVIKRQETFEDVFRTYQMEF